MEIAELKDTLKEKEDKITNLEGRSVTREVLLGKVEGELATCQQAPKEKTEALAAQVACKHPEVDITCFTPDNYVADGNIVPRLLNQS